MTETMAILKGALISENSISSLVEGRVADEPPQGFALPFIRFGQTEMVQDGTDGTQGALVQVGLVVHSRPSAGRIEASKICEELEAYLHQRPEVLAPGYAAVGLSISEIEVQTWAVSRARDGKTYEGRVALEISLDA